MLQFFPNLDAGISRRKEKKRLIDSQYHESQAALPA